MQAAQSTGRPMKTIAVMTSGGDAPGMNAAIRAVVRAATHYKMKTFGVVKGYEGLINSNFITLNAQSVCNILHHGGTFLKSARCLEFKEKEGREKGFDNLQQMGIEGLVVIGGDGSFTGANILYKEFGVPVVGIPGTIDNDLAGTDFTIGYDTACNTAASAIDKIRDTASSHERLFFVEVMGRDSGSIAVNAGISGGAISTIIPESDITLDELIEMLRSGEIKERGTSLIIVAEGGHFGGAYQISEQVKEQLGDDYDIRVTILGHLQRGGAPSSLDRVLASRLGVAAVEGLMQGKAGVMVGMVDKAVVYTSLEEALSSDKGPDPEDFRIAEILAF